MRQAARTARYDQALGLEAYSLRAVDRPFPSHFHDHYVIGVVERGTRTLTCGRQQQVIGPGDVLLFNPGDSHACIQADGSLDYRGLNIPRSTMLALAEEIMGSRAMPGFSVAVPGRVYRDAASDDGVTPSEFFAQSPRARSTCSTMSRTAPSPPRNSET